MRSFALVIAACGRLLALLAVVSAVPFLSACRTTAAAKAPVYLIRIDKGDTLASVATKYDTTWDKIARLNSMESGAGLRVGAVLRVQPGPGGLVAQSGGLYTGGGRLPARLPAKVKSRGGGGNANQAEDEFQESDFPAAAGDQTAGSKKRGGLFFDGSGKDGGPENARGSLDWPILGELSSPFGMRNGHFHRGVDIRAATGSAVVAAGSGTVEFAGKQNGYGKVVIIRHRNVKTVYAHLSSMRVSVGDKVTHRTEIGATGMSGNSTGPHLHFEVRNLGDESIDPLSIMEKDKLLTSAR